MENLTPTAKIIAQIAIDGYVKGGGRIWAKELDDLSNAQIAGFNAIAEWHENQAGQSNAPSKKHPSHKTRCSVDSSTYDEICELCGAIDIACGGWGNLAKPCPKATP